MYQLYNFSLNFICTLVSSSGLGSLFGEFSLNYSSDVLISKLLTLGDQNYLYTHKFSSQVCKCETCSKTKVNL